MHASLPSPAALNCDTNGAPARNTIGCGSLRNDQRLSAVGDACVRGRRGRLLAGSPTAAGPIFLHSLGYLLALLRAHGFPSPAIGSSHYMGVRIRGPLQFLE